MLYALLIHTCTYAQEILPHAFRNTYPAHKGKNLQFGSSTVHACISHLPSSSSSSGSSFKILAMRLLCAASSLACLRTFRAVSFHECSKSTLRESLAVHVILRTKKTESVRVYACPHPYSSNCTCSQSCKKGYLSKSSLRS